VSPMSESAWRTPSSDSANGCGGATTTGWAERGANGDRPSLLPVRLRGGRGGRMRTLGDCSPQIANAAGTSALASTQPPCSTEKEGRLRGTLEDCHARWHGLCLSEVERGHHIYGRRTNGRHRDASSGYNAGGSRS